MSQSLTVPLRDRWAARSMVVSKWLTTSAIRLGDDVCELLCDGTHRMVKADRIVPTDFASPIWHYVSEGAEVGPWGSLLELSSNMNANERPRVFHSSTRRPLRLRDRYPRIFLNYRRDDADAYAGRLHESLSAAFGRDEVFMDLFSIRPGEIFPWTVQQAVAHTDVVVSLIGPKWLSLVDHNGNRRIDGHFDFVRLELTAAWDRGVRIIPVLLPGASVPARASLPQDIAGLEELQMLELAPRYWEAGLAELVSEIRAELQGGQAPHQPR